MKRYLTLLLTMVLVGCGYSSGSLITSKYHTIHVPIWQTQERRRGLEVALTRALVQALEARTRLKVVSTRRAADTVLSGEVVSLQERVLTEDASDNVQEERVILTVNFTWQDTRTNSTILARRGFRVYADAALPLGESELTASNLALYKLAEKIVEELQTQW